ncbi:MAG: Chemotaxis protein CheW [Smithella sp. PtaU1.Bin162]|nr:MAG: Chemotaxis protein CheW [Smithella sp. PtaU1.Bin162]
METEATKITDQTIQNTANREGKYLTFSLAGEEYGIGILKVKEIIGLISITPVPQTPSHIKGVINLRGKVIPIVDLRIKFGIKAMDYTERTCIIVVEIASGNHKISMGIVVDSVSEVLNIKAAEIEDTPNFGTRLDTSYILGMAKTAQSVKILLDIDKVMSNKEIEQLAAA